MRTLLDTNFGAGLENRHAAIMQVLRAGTSPFQTELQTVEMQLAT